MKHIMKVSVSKDPGSSGKTRLHKIPIREHLLNKLFGAAGQVVVLIHGNTVQTVSITEVPGVDAADTHNPVGCGLKPERSRYEAIRN